MARTSPSQVTGLFAHFAKACGKRIATRYDDVGAWGLDHNGVYGGYVIYEVINSGGAQSHPFGSGRAKASEMWSKMRFALMALELPKGRTDPRRRAARRDPRRVTRKRAPARRWSRR